MGGGVVHAEHKQQRNKVQIQNFQSQYLTNILQSGQCEKLQDVLEV